MMSDIVSLRVQDMTWLKHMRRFHEFLPIGTVIRSRIKVRATTEWREDICDDPREPGGLYCSHFDESKMVYPFCGGHLSWSRPYYRDYEPGECLFMLLGHVVFPWATFRARLHHNGRYYMNPEQELCVQVWQPMKDGNRPFADSFLRSTREVLIRGSQGFKTTKFHKNETIPGLSFELANRLFLDYQSPLVKGFISRLEKR